MLFRPQAVEYQNQNNEEGKILLRSPRIFWFFSILAMLLCLALIVLMIVGKHVQRANLNGHLIWNVEPISIIATKEGVIDFVKPSGSNIQAKQVTEKVIEHVTVSQVLFNIIQDKVSYPVVAEHTGQVAAMHVKHGQRVIAGQLLAQIISHDAKLEAELLAPSSAVAYIKPGQIVSLRYEAFPYQKFGQFRGVVREVSRLSHSVGTEKLFRVMVSLDEQKIPFFSQQLSLQADMAAEADVELYSRTLFESLFESLFLKKSTP